MLQRILFTPKSQNQLPKIAIIFTNREDYLMKPFPLFRGGIGVLFILFLSVGLPLLAFAQIVPISFNDYV